MRVRVSRAQISRADTDRYLGLMYARLPENVWVGVQYHGLNELWKNEDDEDAATA